MHDSTERDVNEGCVDEYGLEIPARFKTLQGVTERGWSNELPSKGGSASFSIFLLSTSFPLL